MFSTTPITRKPVFLQKVSSRRTSPTDTAWRAGERRDWPVGTLATRSREWHPAPESWDGAPPYLGCGDDEGPQGTVGAQGVHGRHVLIRGARGRVHNQVVQLSPGHIRHELPDQRCKDPGRPGRAPTRLPQAAGLHPASGTQRDLCGSQGRPTAPRPHTVDGQDEHSGRPLVCPPQAPLSFLLWGPQPPHTSAQASAEDGVLVPRPRNSLGDAGLKEAAPHLRPRPPGAGHLGSESCPSCRRTGSETAQPGPPLARPHAHLLPRDARPGRRPGGREAGSADPTSSSPFFLGPRHTTASSGSSSKKPTDIREMLCSWSTNTGTQPLSH